MLYTLAVVVVVAWLLGYGVFHVAGNMIHLLLPIAVVIIVWQAFRGRRVSL